MGSELRWLIVRCGMRELIEVEDRDPYEGRVQDYGRPTTLNHEQKMKCAQLREDGMTYEQIANYMDVSSSVVFRAVRAVMEGRG
jgi:hypothetical protein